MSVINRDEIDFVLAVLQVVGVVTPQQRIDAWDKMSRIPEGITLSEAKKLLLDTDVED